MKSLHQKSLLLLASAATMAGCTWNSSPPPSYLYLPQQSVYYYPPGPTDLPPQQNFQPPQQKPVDPKEMTADSKYTAQQLDQILGPVALYPDPLLIQVLTAATQPTQITDLDQFLKTNASPTDEQIAAQNWDPSVKGLAKVPSVVQMMAGKMDWTQALGWAMVNQQGDVMDSVQRLRAQARKAKSLETTPQQQVVEQGGTIQIVPVQPDVIYVPYYDPYAVYGYPYPYDPYAWGFGFGFGIAFGSACYIDHHYDHNCDWNNRTIYQGRSWGKWNGAAAAGTPLKRWTPSAGAKVTAPATAFVPPRPVDEFHRVSRTSGRAPVVSGAPSGAAPSTVTPSRSMFTGPTSPRAPAMPSAIPSSPGGDHHRDRGSSVMTAPPMPASIPQNISPPTIQSFSGPSPSIAPSISPSSPPRMPQSVSSPQRMVIPVAPAPIQSSPSGGSDYHRDRGGSSSFSPSPSVQSAAPARSSPPPSPPPQASAPRPAPAPSPAPSSDGSGGHRRSR